MNKKVEIFNKRFNPSIKQAEAAYTPKRKTNTKVKQVESLMAGVLCVLSFIIPWIFTHYTYEFYEITKNTVLILGVMILLSLWAIKIVRAKKLTFVRTPLDLPILLFLGTQILSTIFSIYKQASFWGYYSRFTGGLFSTFILILLYYIIVNNINKKKYIEIIIKTSLVSFTLLAFFTVLKSFGVFQGLFDSLATAHPSLEFLNSLTFTPVGNPNSLPYLFILILPIVLAFISREDEEDFTNDIFAILSSSIILLAIGVTSVSPVNVYSIIVWLLVSGIIVVSLIYKSPVSKNVLLKFFPIFLFAIFSALFAMSSSMREIISDDINFTRYPDVPFDTEWAVITGTFKEHKIGGFLIGTGLDTYAYNFVRFRPEEQNLESNWYQNYTRSSNQIYDLLSNSGIIGFSSFVLLGVVIFSFLIKKLLKREIGGDNIKFTHGVGITLIVILFISFITIFPITVLFILWLFLGLIVATYYLQNERVKEKYKLSLLLSKSKIAIEKEKDIISYIFGGIIAIFVIICTFFVMRNFIAEVQFKRTLIAMNFGAINEANDNILKAINKNDKRDHYHRQLAYVSLLALRDSVSQVSEEYEESIQAYQTYLISVIREEVEITISINELDYANWETAAVIFKQLVDLSAGQLYGNETLYATSQAIMLNPYNPDNYIILGYIYQYNANEELKGQAEQVFFRAYALRPDYALSTFALGNYLEFVKKYDEAIALYQNSITNYYPSESEINTLLRERIEAVREKQEGVGEIEEQSSPTDEEITREVEDNVSPW